MPSRCVVPANEKSGAENNLTARLGFGVANGFEDFWRTLYDPQTMAEGDQRDESREEDKKRDNHCGDLV